MSEMKPPTRISYQEWACADAIYKQEGHKSLSDTIAVIGNSRALRNDVNIGSKWESYYNKVRLHQRVSEVKKGLSRLEGLLQGMKDEISNLKDERVLIDNDIEFYNKVSYVLTDCFRFRDIRENRDVCDDEPNKQFKKEEELVEGFKEKLTKISEGAFEQIGRLETTICHVSSDIQCKLEAIRTDMACATLDRTCTDVCHRPDVFTVPSNMTSNEEWLRKIDEFIKKTEEQLKKGFHVRQEANLKRKQFREKYITQLQTTDYELRKRIALQNKFKNELEWQKLNAQDLQKSIYRELLRLNYLKQDKISDIKCAESKIELRNLRWGLERVLDCAQSGIYEELRILQDYQNAMTYQADGLKRMYNTLELLNQKFDDDLRIKYLSIQTDFQCLELRVSALQNPAVDTTHLVRKLELEIPKNEFASLFC